MEDKRNKQEEIDETAELTQEEMDKVAGGLSIKEILELGRPHLAGYLPTENPSVKKP